MATFRESVPKLVSALDRFFGRPRRFDADQSLYEKLIVRYWERAVSASQAAAAVQAFHQAGLLDPDDFVEFDPVSLQDLLRQSGLNVAAKSLAPLRYLIAELIGFELDLLSLDADSADHADTAALVDVVATIRGIGPTTTDDILLRVFRRPRYPLDRATYRILLRHGWIDSTTEAEETTDLIVRGLDGDPDLLAELSDWFAALGRSHCRAAGPRCDGCPLQPLLPEGGPVDPES